MRSSLLGTWRFGAGLKILPMASEIGPANASLFPLTQDDQLQFVFVGGKGGVGKTTCSSALALSIAMEHRKRRPSDKVLIISTDPAHNLSDAFAQQLSGVPTPVEGADGLWAMETDPALAMEKDIADVASGLEQANEEEEQGEDMGLISEFKQWLQSVPGIDEAMALSAVIQHVDSGEFGCIVFDTAPTGHTLRLLQLPMVLEVGLQKLQSWKARLGGLVTSLTSMVMQNKSAEARQAALRKLEEKLQSYQDGVGRISKIFQDVDRTQFVCVCIAEHLSVFETQRLCSELKEAGIASKHILVNMLMPRALAGVTPETGGASGVSKALAGAGVGVDVAAAVQEAVELCGARTRIQQHYLKQLQQATKDTHTTTLLPLLNAEVRGVPNLTSFAQRLLHPDPRLAGDASGETHAYNPLSALSESYSAKAQNGYGMMAGAMKTAAALRGEQDQEDAGDSAIEIGARVKIQRLEKAPQYNGRTGVVASFDPEASRYHVQLDGGKKKPKTLALRGENMVLADAGAPAAASANAGSDGLNVPSTVTPEMIQLAQSILMRPGGFQQLLARPEVAELKRSDEEMLKFFSDLETKGLMAGLGYLSNTKVMGTVAEIARKMQAEE